MAVAGQLSLRVAHAITESDAARANAHLLEKCLLAWTASTLPIAI